MSIHDVPESVARFERQLADGSTLEYRLSVLQQPERARACGMGAKCQYLQPLELRDNSNEIFNL
jgi:hypothetical protein